MKKEEIVEIIEEKLDRQRSLEHLVETKFKETKDNLSHSINQKLRFGAVVVVILGLIGAWIGRDVVHDAAQSQVENQLAIPEVQRAVKAALEETSKDFVTEKITPLEERVESSKSYLATVEENVRTLSKETEKLRLFFDARYGKRSAYQVIADTAKKTSGPTDVLAKSIYDDLKLYYEDFKYKGLPKKVIHLLTKRYYRLPAESIHHHIYHHIDPYQRRAKINEIANRGLKYFVEDLATIVRNDPNLKVASRAVLAIERLTGKDFSDFPPFLDVQMWWQEIGHMNETFKSPFSKLEKANQLFFQGQIEKAVRLFEEVTQDRKGFGITHHRIALICKKKGDFDKAKDHLKKVEEECDGQLDSLFFLAELYLREDNRSRAIELLRKAKPYCADFEERVTKHPSFKKLEDEEDFRNLLGGSKE